MLNTICFPDSQTVQNSNEDCFLSEHKNVLVSPGVLTGVLINGGLQCHNNQATGFALGRTQFLLTLGYCDLGGLPEGRSCLTDGLTVPPPGDPDRFAPWLGCQRLVFPLLKEIANSKPFYAKWFVIQLTMLPQDVADLPGQ